VAVLQGQLSLSCFIHTPKNEAFWGVFSHRCFNTKSVHSFSKYRVLTKRTNDRTDTLRTLYQSVAWRKHKNNNSLICVVVVDIRPTVIISLSCKFGVVVLTFVITSLMIICVGQLLVKLLNRKQQQYKMYFSRIYRIIKHITHFDFIF